MELQVALDKLPVQDPAVEELELQPVEAEVPVAEVTVVEKETYAELQLEEEFLVAGSHPAGRGLAT